VELCVDTDVNCGLCLVTWSCVYTQTVEDILLHKSVCREELKFLYYSDRASQNRFVSYYQLNALFLNYEIQNNINHIHNEKKHKIWTTVVYHSPKIRRITNLVKKHQHRNSIQGHSNVTTNLYNHKTNSNITTWKEWNVQNHVQNIS